jgi:hypothetical protein
MKNKHMQQYSTSLITREMQIKVIIRYTRYTSIKIATIKKTQTRHRVHTYPPSTWEAEAGGS